MGSSGATRISAELNRKIMEAELIESFHWTYEQIDNTPYKKILELFMILGVKGSTRDAKAAQERVRAQAASAAKSGKRGGYREV